MLNDGGYLELAKGTRGSAVEVSERTWNCAWPVKSHSSSIRRKLTSFASKAGALVKSWLSGGLMVLVGVPLLLSVYALAIACNFSVRALVLVVDIVSFPLLVFLRLVSIAL